MEFVLHENADKKKEIVLGLLANTPTCEMAIEKMTHHLRTLSAGFTDTLSHKHLSLILNPDNTLEELFTHYSSQEAKKISTQSGRHIGTVEKETENDKKFKELAFKKLGELNFAPKLKNFEDRLMGMIEQYFEMKKLTEALQKKLYQLKLKLWSRQFDRRILTKTLLRAKAHVNSIAEAAHLGQPSRLQVFKNLIKESTEEHCMRNKENHPIERNEFEEGTEEATIKPSDHELLQEIKNFVDDVDDVIEILLTTENKKKTSKNCFETIRTLSMHIFSQAAQYFDAAAAIDILTDMKNDLQTLQSTYLEKIEQYYTIKEKIQHIRASTYFLRNLGRALNPTILPGYNISEEFVFFNYFNEYF